MSCLAKLAAAPGAGRRAHELVAAALRRVGSASASTSSPAVPRGRIAGGRHESHHRRRPHPQQRRRLARTSAAADVDTDAILDSYLDDAQMDQVRTFATTLLEKNKVMNLTGALTVDEVLGRHVADSLALIPAIERALDAGAPPFAAYGPSPLAALFTFGEYYLVCRPDFPDRHAWLVARTLTERRGDFADAAPASADLATPAAHPGALLYAAGAPEPAPPPPREPLPDHPADHHH